MNEKSERIAKVIAAAGLCSRRDAEGLIAQGRVRVNGVVLTTPAMTVTSADRVEVDGKILAEKAPLRLWLFHKPPGLVTTSHDPQNRETVFSVLPKTLGRVISVGRLDLNSEGLLLLTNDGGFSRYLELPQHELPRHYTVRVFGRVDAAALTALEQGITIDGVQYRGMQVEQDDPASTAMNQWLHITLYEGKNREIRKVMAALGLQVNRLIRVGYGPFRLNDLPIGEVMEAPHTTLQEFCREIGFAS